MHTCHHTHTHTHTQEGGAGGEAGERRVSVIETSTGNKITGEDAPMRKDLEQWLQKHPG